MWVERLRAIGRERERERERERRSKARVTCRQASSKFFRRMCWKAVVMKTLFQCWKPLGAEHVKFQNKKWKRYFNVESPEEQNMRNFKIKSGKLISTLKDAVFCNYLSTNCILCLKNFDEGGWHFHSFPCVVRHFPQSCCQQPRLDSLTFTPEAIGGSSFTHNYPPNYRQTATGITFSWHNARCVLFFTHNYPRNYPESVAGIALSYRVVGSC